MCCDDYDLTVYLDEQLDDDASGLGSFSGAKVRVSSSLRLTSCVSEFELDVDMVNPEEALQYWGPVNCLSIEVSRQGGARGKTVRG